MSECVSPPLWRERLGSSLSEFFASILSLSLSFSLRKQNALKEKSIIIIRSFSGVFERQDQNLCSALLAARCGLRSALVKVEEETTDGLGSEKGHKQEEEEGGIESV